MRFNSAGNRALIKTFQLDSKIFRELLSISFYFQSPGNLSLSSRRAASDGTKHKIAFFLSIWMFFFCFAFIWSSENVHPKRRVQLFRNDFLSGPFVKQQSENKRKLFHSFEGDFIVYRYLSLDRKALCRLCGCNVNGFCSFQFQSTESFIFVASGWM